ncbi:MAG: hypothetical protein OJF62_000451 [Pseudolabrys sp.]|nr:hypothetical protein [Pseudolabrys sp.]
MARGHVPGVVPGGGQIAVEVRIHAGPIFPARCSANKATAERPGGFPRDASCRRSEGRQRYGEG